ncbi:MAG TPA: multicopper oxidase domain-containing protein [Thermomicrobiales bacterium]|nr:multicopper oxidase domain-containing protein [Thermomicrobiales bacterium]
MSAASAAGGSLLFPASNVGSATVRGQSNVPEFAEPPVIRSKDGVLEATLVAQPQQYTGLGTVTYGGTVPGPTLRLSAGDLLKIKLINHLSEDPNDETSATNLHVHGFHVSPVGHGDNVFRHLMPGEEWDFAYQIPEDHPSGLYWYHPHPHKLTNGQVEGGLAGAIVIEGAIDKLPQTDGVKERLLVIQGFPTSGHVVNGLVDPTLRIRQGEWQRWRVLNATGGVFMNLHLDGHVLHRISADGNVLPQVGDTDTLLMAPAERAELLIQGGAPNTDGYALRSLSWSGNPVEFQLATLLVEAEGLGPDESGAAGAPLAPDLIGSVDLRGADPIQRRVITFRSGFKISHSEDESAGQLFDPERVDQWVDLGTTEEWVLHNDTNFWHPFHIHVNDFQVISSNGEDQMEPFVYYKDTLPLPPKIGDVPGEVVLRIPFLDYAGKFVYHCHILSHEDAGMMGVVEVVYPIAIGENGFDPVAIEILAETSIRWTNRDTQSHTVTADDGSFDSADIAPGDSFVRTFDEPTTVSYHCKNHPNLEATIRVT